MPSSRKIVTQHVFPSIPYRGYDWCAYFRDEGEEAARYGWGSCEAAAIADLETRFGEES